jgi:hypothetical protein
MSAIDHKVTVSEETGQTKPLLGPRDIAEEPATMRRETQAETATPWQLSGLVSALLSPGAREVVWHWISQKQFLDDQNQPRLLYPDSSDGIDFDSLIKSVDPLLAPAIVRNELLRKGIVEQNGNDCFLLRRIAFVIGAPSVEDRYFFT